MVPKHKRMTTFTKEGQLTSGLVPVDITACDLYSAMVWENGVRAELNVTKIDALNGRYRVSYPAELQSLWPLGPAVWDVVFVFQDRIESTSTFRIEVVREVSVPAGPYVEPTTPEETT